MLVPANRRQQADDAVGGAGADLGEHQAQDDRVAADIAERLAHRAGRVRGGLGLLHRAANAGDQPRRDQEGQRVDRERGLAAEQLGDDPADAGTDHQHRAPHRAHERLGRGELVGLDEVGGRGAGDRIGEARPDGEGDHGADRERGRAPPRREAQHERDRHAREIGDHEDALAIEAIGDRAGDRRGEEHRQDGGGVHEGRRAGPPGQLGDQARDGDEREPVAGERHHARQEQPAEVAVAYQQRARRQHACTLDDRAAACHGAARADLQAPA
jgi:hypothetical protein